MTFARSANGNFDFDPEIFEVVLVTEPGADVISTIFELTKAHTLDLHGSTQFLNYYGFQELDLESLQSQNVSGVRIEFVGHCFPSHNLFSNCGILYKNKIQRGLYMTL